MWFKYSLKCSLELDIKRITIKIKIIIKIVIKVVQTELLQHDNNNITTRELYIYTTSKFEYPTPHINNLRGTHRIMNIAFAQ
jgi:hypothetical protein